MASPNIPRNQINSHYYRSGIISKRQLNKIAKQASFTCGDSRTRVIRSIGESDVNQIMGADPKCRRFEVNDKSYNGTNGYVAIKIGYWTRNGNQCILDTDSDEGEYDSSSNYRTLSVQTGWQYVILTISNEAYPDDENKQWSEPDTLKATISTNLPTSNETCTQIIAATVYANEDRSYIYIVQNILNDINDFSISQLCDLTDVDVKCPDESPYYDDYQLFALNYVEKTWTAIEIDSLYAADVDDTDPQLDFDSAELQEGAVWKPKLEFDFTSDPPKLVIKVYQECQYT